ncbi:DHH family phosphoesterase [Vibrio sp. JC009]|uniref:DHH family phosphoesterase n=1 Tax=Vibrio sp. JC009 TaxID=2912314 RepID=UPI0023B0EF2E|nr:DHH family phosphoesterase [Vibrio sp. JC009]WED20628.1 DHH family phosphoesterase [Vibrio sp. JC009]
MHYDVFNGDADGIIALLQLRLAEPKDATLVTGVKRDIKLLEKVVAEGDASGLTVLDVSMEKNMPALEKLLEQGVKTFYCDHHRTGDIPESEHLEALIDLDSEVCTSLLINNRLQGEYVSWAIAAAFGDNLISTASKIAEEQGLSKVDTEFLKELGTLVNYNGYGAATADLHIAPDHLYKALLEYSDPFMLRDDLESPYYQLKKGYEADMANLSELSPLVDSSISRVFELPCEAWARRISGVFGNQLANEEPGKAHAVLTLNGSGEDYTVSVRAPLENRTGADEVCTQFPTGGGRKAAAGINALPVADKARFTQVLEEFYQ